jgi:hypothetical protein
MYLKPFLASQAKRGFGKGQTPGTFVASQLTGVRKRYEQGYVNALENALKTSLKNGEVIEGASIAGRPTYYPIEVSE